MLKYKKGVALILCAALIFTATACSKSDDENLQSDKDGKVFSVSDEISIPVRTIRDLNPVTSHDADMYQVSKLLYDSLIALDDTLTPIPALAESWEHEGNTVSFKLRNNVHFSDGADFSAKDVVFTFNAYKSASGSIYTSKLSNIRNAKAEGDSTVIFTYSNIGNASLSDFTFPIFSSSQFSSVSNMLKSGEKPLIGTGRYMITDVDTDKEIKLVPNAQYYGKKPENSITLEVIPTNDIYMGLVTAGDISINVYTQTDRENLNGNEEVKVTEFYSNQFEALGFNCNNEILKNRDIRKAICMLIDRDEIINTSYYNNGTKNDDLYYPGFYGSEVGSFISVDTKKAAELLKNAGYMSTDTAGYLLNSENKRLSLKLMVDSGNSMRTGAAEMIKTELSNNGINVSIEKVSTDTFQGKLDSGAYDMFIGGWQIDEGYDLKKFYHSGYGNYAKYSNSKVDMILDEMFINFSIESTGKDIANLRNILHEDVPYFCLMYKTYAAVTSSNLQGIIAPRFNDYYFACDDWHIRMYKNRNSENK